MLTPVAFNILGNAATVTGLTFASGKSLTVNNILTLAGTDSSTLNVGAGGTLGSAAFTAASAYQPSNSNLTAIAALTTAAYGRSLLEAANAGAAQTLLGVQPTNNPAFTGTPTVPTAVAGTNTTQIASTAFVADAIGTAVTGLLEFKGSANCSGNPNYPAASKGDGYLVSTAGKIGGASGKPVDVGDWYVATADNAGGTEASVGTSWTVIEHNLQGALLSANNLSDVASVPTARTSLGLGTGDSPTFAGVTASTFTGALTGTASGNALTGAVTGSGLTMATARLLGRATAATGAIEEITVGTGLSLSGGTLSATATVSGGNPTANVGLSAVNGSASTFLRSDGAPALDVGIVPTWTGNHRFNAKLLVNTAGINPDGMTDVRFQANGVADNYAAFIRGANSSSHSFGLLLTSTTAESDIPFAIEADTSARYFFVTGTGNVVVGSAAIATNATTGFLYMPSCAGTPTGTPVTYTGRTPMVYDTTNNKFYVYNGAWKSVTLA